MLLTLRTRLLQYTLVILLLSLAFSTAHAGPKAYVGNFKDNTVSVIDTATDQVVATIPVAVGPHGMAITPDGRRVYVSSDGANIVSIINTAIDRVEGTIVVGKSPHGVTLLPDTKLLLVAVNGEDKIAFVDVPTLSIVDSVPVGKPHTIAVTPDGKTAYISSQVPGHFGLAVIDIATHSVVRTIPLDKTPRDLEYGFDSHAFYFTEAGISAVEVLDPASDKIVAEIPTGLSPHYVNHFRNATYGMAIVQGPGELFLFDPRTKKAVRSIKVGDQPHWLALSGDGKTAFVTNEGSNTLSIVDIASGKTKAIAVGNMPRKVVVQPASPDAKVSIENFEFIPPVVTVSPGEAVVWTNNDGGPHAIAFKDGAAGSDSLFPRKTFSRTFEQPGNYDYYCSIHTYMTGRVEVKQR